MVATSTGCASSQAGSPCLSCEQKASPEPSISHWLSMSPEPSPSRVALQVNEVLGTEKTKQRMTEIAPKVTRAQGRPLLGGWKETLYLKNRFRLKAGLEGMVVLDSGNHKGMDAREGTVCFKID